jgi:hypothetical protein
MADTKQPSIDDDPRVQAYQTEYKSDYLSDWEVHRVYIQSFDPYEAMLIGMVYDSVSGSVDGSKITDSYTTTLAKERADRVMAKLPDGIVESAGKVDVGKAAFMDILRQKWIYPNANAQQPFQEKLNLWQFYSAVYGYMLMFYDWNVRPDGTAGPDCWLWNPRYFVPQQGRISIDDMDYATALTWVGKSYLRRVLGDATGKKVDDNDGDDDAGANDVPDTDDLTNQDGWNRDALQLLLDLNETSEAPDPLRDSQVMRQRTPLLQKRGILLATRHEAGEDGEWVTFAPNHGFIEVRRIKNPHKNGRIPFVAKYSQPLFDSFYGLGDFQRAKPLQFARDGLINFYFKGIKMNLVPPVVANANGVVKQTLDYREGAVMLETIPNSIRRLETSTAGLATYQAAQESLTASLLSMFGSQNANISTGSALNPSQGKTPQAIDLYADKEATRDGAEVRHLETAITRLTEGFFDLVANIGTEEIPVALFTEDIQDIIKSGLGDLQGIFTAKNFTPNATKTGGILKIKPGSLKGVDYRFKINPNSTMLVNQQQQLQSLMDMMDRLGKYQNVLQGDPTITIHWDKIMQAYETLTNIPGASEFITFDPNAQPQPQPQAPPQASATAVKTPGGQVAEQADLVKLYQIAENSQDKGLMNQIVQALGFQPSPQQQPLTVAPSGHVFRDPEIGAAATALQQAATSGPMAMGAGAGAGSATMATK